MIAACFCWIRRRRNRRAWRPTWAASWPTTWTIRLGESPYDGAALTDFSLDGDGFAVLALDTQQAGGRPVLRTVDDQGNLLGEISAEGEITAVSAAGRYVAVLTAAGLQIYTSDLTLYAETDDTAGALDVAARADGTVLRIGSTGARLYVP